MARGRGCAPWEPRERVGTGNMAGTQLFSLSFIHSRSHGYVVGSLGRGSHMEVGVRLHGRP